MDVAIRHYKYDYLSGVYSIFDLFQRKPYLPAPPFIAVYTLATAPLAK